MTVAAALLFVAWLIWLIAFALWVLLRQAQARGKDALAGWARSQNGWRGTLDNLHGQHAAFEQLSEANDTLRSCYDTAMEGWERELALREAAEEKLAQVTSEEGPGALLLNAEIKPEETP